MHVFINKYSNIPYSDIDSVCWNRHILKLKESIYKIYRATLLMATCVKSDTIKPIHDRQEKRKNALISYIFNILIFQQQNQNL